MSGINLTEVAHATIPTPDTNTATIFLSSSLGQPAYKDDTGTVTSLVGAAGAAGTLTYLDHGNTGATETVTASGADIHRLVADSATVTLTLNGWPASGTPSVIRLILVQDATGGRDWVFPAAVTFGLPGEPDWTSRAASAVDIVDLQTVDGGTTVIATVAGRPGPQGGAVTIPYTFSTTTTDADPGAGFLRLSNATQNASTVIRADHLASDGTDWSAVLPTLDDSTNTIDGHIRLYRTDDPSKWLLFTVSAVGSESGYKNITVANVGSSASSPFTNNAAITLAFTRAGDKGADGAAGAGAVTPSLCNGRLTLTTGVPVTTADVTAATTLYFTPFRGNQISTYDGAAWSTSTFTEKSITLATLTAGLPYDCFIVDSTLALELLAWTNTTTRATALTTQDGILVKTGATTRRYLGTICIAATGQSEDSLARRLVWNYYNRVQRPLQVFDGTDSWTYGTATWRQARASAANQVDFVTGVSEDLVMATVQVGITGAAGTAGSVGVGVDSTSANSAQHFTESNAAGAISTLMLGARYRGYVAVGYHYLAWLEYSRAGTTGYQGDNGVADQQSGLIAEVWA